MHKPEAFLDLHRLSEDQRIDMIGHTVTEHGKTVAVCVDDITGKPERYIAKVQKLFPGVAVLGQFKGPTPGVVTIKFGPQ
jgi:hypothetical protein